MTDLAALGRANAKRWADAKPIRNFTSVAKRLIAPNAKVRYETVSRQTGVPWPVIAVIHERECSQDWTRSLAQGDPWDRISVHVPAGRGPFRSWEDAAIDALNNCAPYAGRNNDWSIGVLLTVLEGYNGLGYAARGLPSPYVWAGTDQYRAGKYVRDGVYDPNAVDTQLGCAGLLMAMRALDPALASLGQPAESGTRPTSSPAAASESTRSKPSTRNPAAGSIGAWILSMLLALFKRKGK